MLHSTNGLDYLIDIWPRQLLTSIYLRQLTLSKKHHALRCPMPTVPDCTQCPPQHYHQFILGAHCTVAAKLSRLGILHHIFISHYTFHINFYPIKPGIPYVTAQLIRQGQSQQHATEMSSHMLYYLYPCTYWPSCSSSSSSPVPGFLNPTTAPAALTARTQFPLLATLISVMWPLTWPSCD